MNELGKFLRKFRIDRDNISLRDMASELGISASLLSSYETGRRPIPDDDSLYLKLKKKYRLNDLEDKTLRQAIDRSLKSYKVDLEDVDPEVRDQYVAFARKLPGFSPSDFEALLKGFEDEDD